MIFRNRSLSAATVLVPCSSRLQVRVPLRVSLLLSISFHAGLGLPKRRGLNGENPSFLFFFQLAVKVTEGKEGGTQWGAKTLSEGCKCVWQVERTILLNSYWRINSTRSSGLWVGVSLFYCSGLSCCTMQKFVQKFFFWHLKPSPKMSTITSTYTQITPVASHWCWD